MGMDKMVRVLLKGGPFHDKVTEMPVDLIGREGKLLSPELRIQIPRDRVDSQQWAAVPQFAVYRYVENKILEHVLEGVDPKRLVVTAEYQRTTDAQDTGTLPGTSGPTGRVVG